MLLKNKSGRIVAVSPGRAQKLVESGFKTLTEDELKALQPAKQKPAKPSVKTRASKAKSDE